MINLNVIALYDYGRMAQGTIMVVLYIWLIALIWRGNRNKWLLMVSGMLLLSNIGSIGLGYSLYMTTVEDILWTGYAWTIGVSAFLESGFFCISHYLLAVKYQTMSQTVMLVIDGQARKKETTWDKVIFWLILSLNVMLPLYRALVAIEYRLKLLNGESIQDWVYISSNISIAGVGLLQVLSGTILIISVVKIHRFFVKKQAADFINTRMLLRHAASFGIYTLSMALYYAASCIHIWDPHDDEMYEIVATVGIGMEIGSLISQILLVVIFRDLGKTVNEADPEDKSSLLSNLMVDDFDEDAEL